MPNFTFIREKCGNRAPKLSTFGMFPTNLSLRGKSFAQILRNSQHLHVSIASFLIFTARVDSDFSQRCTQGPRRVTAIRFGNRMVWLPEGEKF